MSSRQDYDYDLVVIGGGSGGLAASKRAAAHGARVALVEGDRVGGTCVIRGCIPKKLMYYAAHLGGARALAADYGWPAPGPQDRQAFDWEHLVASRNRVVGRLETVHEGHLANAGVELVRGRAHLTGAHRVNVGGRELTAANILVATGSRPVMPKLKGAESAVSSDGFFEIDKLPASALLVGGGYIACEFAGMLQALGCQVTMLVRSSLLRGFDAELAANLADAMRQQGIDLHLHTSPESLEPAEGGVVCRYRDAEGSHRVQVETCMVFAIGRLPNTLDLGLEEISVKLGGKGEVLVDDDHRTNIGSVYAVGDVTDRSTLTPVAIKAGRLVADRLFAGSEARMSYENIPTAIFSQPPIGTVGLTEEQAHEKYGEQGVTIYRERFRGMLYSFTPEDRKQASLMKMVVHKDTGRVLGLHMIGPDAPEIIQGFAVAVRAGLTKEHFDQTIAIHPTSAEEFVLMS